MHTTYYNMDGTECLINGKAPNPYNYDGIMLFTRDGNANNTIYTDRLLQLDYTRHNQLCMKHFNDESQYWSHRYPNKIEAFLRDWCNDESLILISVIEYCNQSTGYRHLKPTRT